MRKTLLSRFPSVPGLSDERGIILAMVLVILSLLMGIGSTAIYSGYTNLSMSTNLKLTAQAKAEAEAGINEALYRLSRQEGQPGALAPDMEAAFWNDANWNVQIHFLSTPDDDPTDDNEVSSIRPGTDWPDVIPTTQSYIDMRYKRPNPPGNNVIFYDANSGLNPPFRTIALPAAVGAIPDTARPVIEIRTVGLANREAEREIFAEVAATVAVPPPAALSSGVNVNMGGSGFIDAADHSHLIRFSDAGGNADIYGDAGDETTDSLEPPGPPSTLGDSPDSEVRHENPPPVPGYTVDARIFNMQVNAGGLPPATPPALVGLSWDPLTNLWQGNNVYAVSAIALEGPAGGPLPNVVNEATPNLNPLGRGIFTWGSSNTVPVVNPGFPVACTGNPPPLVCRPGSLDPFPTFQEFLGLDDFSYQKLLDSPDTLGADLSQTTPPLGFTYINNPGATFHLANNFAAPPDGEYGLMYVRGNLDMKGNMRYKGVIFVDGDLDTAGTNYVLGAVLVRGITETDALGTFQLLYSRRAAELGIQAGHPWRILSWVEADMEN